MKKRVLALTLALLLLLLTACGGVGEKKLAVGKGEVSARFKVVSTLETEGAWVVQLLDDGSTSDIISMSFRGAELYDRNMEPITAADMKSGMELEVVWSGLVQYSHPTKIGNVTAVQVRKQGDDFVGLYRKVLGDLWENDPALNHDVQTLGLDFSGLTNLTDGEKTALAYLFSCDVGLGLQYVTGTWQELGEKGYIDTENLRWEEGVFFSLSVTDEGNGRFTFEAEKWRSGTGAIYFKSCTAKRGADGVWSYDMGAFAIA